MSGVGLNGSGLSQGLVGLVGLTRKRFLECIKRPGRQNATAYLHAHAWSWAERVSKRGKKGCSVSWQQLSTVRGIHALADSRAIFVKSSMPEGCWLPVSCNSNRGRRMQASILASGLIETKHNSVHASPNQEPREYQKRSEPNRPLIRLSNGTRFFFPACGDEC